MASNDGIGKTLGVALALCVVCSVVVSTAAVMLKPAQIANKSLDFKRNVLAAGDMLEVGPSIDEQFKKITTRLVDLDAGRYTDALDVEKYDPMKAAKDPKLSIALSSEQDLAKISRRVNVAKVYLVESEQGDVEKVILPIKGYGLWSTMYGFLALDADLNTVIGFGFYDHGETPGLGGEIDNPSWKALWVGKKVFNNGGDVALQVVKGAANAASEHDIDGLSGATLTSKGVSNLVQFWLGADGYGRYLSNLKDGEA